MWEGFPVLQDNGLFLQSFHQAQLYKDLGQKTWLFECVQSNGVRVRSLVTKVEARRGVFLFLPYGPMVDGELCLANLEGFFSVLKDFARQERAAFIRMSPFWQDTVDRRELLQGCGFRKAPLHMLAETLWLLELNKSEEHLLSEMDKKHRNLIRRAEKEGVSLTMTADSQATERFITMHWQTVERHGFTPYTKDYFRQQVQQFAPDNQVIVAEAWWQGELLASAIVMFYGNVAAYHHGASSSQPEHRKMPASYLLQWEIIREAMRRGCHSYNFWGIAPSEDSKHPFYGITHFKTGFGGYRYDLVPAHDLVIHPKYYLNWTVEKLRKWKRGF